MILALAIEWPQVDWPQVDWDRMAEVLFNPEFVAYAPLALMFIVICMLVRQMWKHASRALDMIELQMWSTHNTLDEVKSKLRVVWDAQLGVPVEVEEKPEDTRQLRLAFPEEEEDDDSVAP